MSTESLVYDVEKGGVVVVRESQAGNGCWKCLSICSFLLLTGATAVFALLQFRNEGQWVIQDFRESRSSGQRQELAGPMTLKLQAQSLTKPAAHVVASHESKELVWNDKVAHTMIQNGMKLVDNKLVVPANGLYFVYSQVVFKGNKCPEESVLLRHIILRFSEEYPQDVPLLTAIKSLCEGSKSAETEVWYESIYQGAVFQLTKGDEISSKIDSADYLDLDSNGQVYFGVIALELGAPQQ